MIAVEFGAVCCPRKRANLTPFSGLFSSGCTAYQSYHPLPLSPSGIAAKLRPRSPIDISSRIDNEVRVQTDEWYLRRLLLNLLDNAIKYNLRFGRIEMVLAKSEDLASFRIANTGAQISEEHQTRIFERFYRTEASRASEIVDSGLGLSICREIVLAHQGQIWMERSRPGWTVFVVNLPLFAPGRTLLPNS